MTVLPASLVTNNANLVVVTTNNITKSIYQSSNTNINLVNFNDVVTTTTVLTKSIYQKNLATLLIFGTGSEPVFNIPTVGQIYPLLYGVN